MQIGLTATVKLLDNTPVVLHALLNGVSDNFIFSNEGTGSWSPFDVLGHLIVCEETNFLTRIQLVLSDSPDKVFKPINMSAQFEAGKGKSIQALLSKFERLRKQNIETFNSFKLTEGDFIKEALHPKLGMVTLNNLLSTWVAHDLTHIAQITRIMAKQYRPDIGPFIVFLPRLN